MSLRDQRQAGAFAFGEFGQAVRQRGAVLERTEVAAVAGAEPMAELVDGPQVESCGVEREAVPVIDAGVLAEPVQEDDGRARLGGSPVAVVGPALRVIDEWHALTAAICASNRKRSGQGGCLFASSRRILETDDRGAEMHESQLMGGTRRALVVAGAVFGVALLAAGLANAADAV